MNDVKCDDTTLCQIYSSVDPGSDEGGLVSVRNSTFLGNVARNYGGAIAAKGAGSVSLSNCTFDGNEAVGSGSYRRAGIGGAVYASPGVHVSVRHMVSTFYSHFTLVV